MSNAAEKYEHFEMDSAEAKSQVLASRAITPSIHIVSQNFGASVSAVIYDAFPEAATASTGEEALGKLVRKLWPLAIKDELAGLSDYDLGAGIIKERHIRNLSVNIVFENVDGLR